MSYVKNNIFKISIILILILAGAFSFYTAASNKQSLNNGMQNSFHNNAMQQGNFNEQNQTPKGNFKAPENGQRIGIQNRQIPNLNSNNSNNISNINEPLFIVYGLVFLALLASAYYFFIYKKIKIPDGYEVLLIASILCLGLFLRISLGSYFEGFSTDLSLFRSWANSAASSLTKVYTNAKNIDYPPLYMYVLFLVGKLSSVSVLSSYSLLLLKLPAIIADIASAFLIYRLSKKYLSMEISLLLSAFYVFNPAVIINSAAWGQVDSFFTLIIIFAFYTLSIKKTWISSACFLLGVLMKPQGIIFLPVLFFEFIRQKSLKIYIKSAASALITTLIVILPFSKNQDILWIVQLFSKTINEYPYASSNALNLFTLLGGNFAKDSSTLFIFSYHTLGFLFIVLITLFSWFIYIKGKDSKFAFAVGLVQIAGVFTFSVGMHERYLFPAAALALLAFIYLRDKRLMVLSLGFSFTSYINTHLVLFNELNGRLSNSLNPLTMLVCLSNVLLFTYLIKVLLNITLQKVPTPN